MLVKSFKFPGRQYSAMNVNPRQKKEELCIREADGGRVGKIFWVIPMIGKSEKIFCELIVIC